MSRENARRAAIIESFRTGHDPKNVVAWFGYPEFVVYRLKKIWDSTEDKENFSFERKVHRRRSYSQRTDAFIANVAETVKTDPSQSMSMSQIARAMNVSKAKIH